MALVGLELHHHAVRMRPEAFEATLTFYEDVLGLHRDSEARDVPEVPLLWMDCANDTQVHLFALEDTSKYARRPDRDPFTAHVAFGVPDIEEAKAELELLGVEFWRVGRDVGQQVFLDDANGNMIELHQIGTCRRKQGSR